MTERSSPRRPIWVTGILLVLSAVMVVVFVLLGNWQVRRLAWKTDLIEAVDARAFGEPVGLPAQFDPDQHAYLRVSVTGDFLPVKPIVVKAVTEIGPGYWAMVPLQTDQGILWINRGFVPPEAKEVQYWTAPAAPVQGLLRPTVPEGTLLEQNRPKIERWVSRDTQAMSQARDLGPTLDYFLDADPQSQPGMLPLGGMTLIKFSNSHLSYALTWYAMAVLFVIALIYVVRSARRDQEWSAEVNPPDSG